MRSGDRQRPCRSSVLDTLEVRCQKNLQKQLLRRQKVSRLESRKKDLARDVHLKTTNVGDISSLETVGADLRSKSRHSHRDGKVTSSLQGQRSCPPPCTDANTPEPLQPVPSAEAALWSEAQKDGISCFLWCQLMVALGVHCDSERTLR